MDFYSKRKNESLIFEKAKAEHPELFKKTSVLEDQKYLSKFGIYIPGKEKFPVGFLRLFPQDFIVEEVSQTGEIYSIEYPEKKSEPVITGQGETFYATLVKCGIGTLEAIEDIALQLNISPEQIHYSGLKDKFAITAQRLAFRHVPLSAIINIKSPYYFLKDIKQGKGILKKGDLLGNRFTIFIRTPENLIQNGQDRTLLEILESINRHGFYNFYYLQRFGVPRLLNHQMGYQILRGQYQEAVETFLYKESVGEIPYFSHIRALAKKSSHDIVKVVEIFSQLPSIFLNEIRMAKHLERNHQDYIGALNTNPDIVLILVSSLSSFFFNHRLSSFAKAKQRPTPLLPLFISNLTKDWKAYNKLLADNKINPPPFENLKHFPNVRLMHRDIKTIGSADIHKCEILDNGVALSFTLDKGEYATTFLSHAFNLISERAPEEAIDIPVDPKKILELGSIDKTAEYFAPVISLESQNLINN